MLREYVYTHLIPQQVVVLP